MQELYISEDKTLLNFDFIFKFLNQEAEWSKGIPREIVARAIANSLCFGAYQHKKQIGFGRVITDGCTFANIVDVFVAAEYRGQGIGKAIMQHILAHRSMQGLRRMTLALILHQLAEF